MYRPDGIDNLLMIPGPTPVADEIRAALAAPTIAHTSPGLADVIRRCQEGIRFVAGGPSADVFLFGGAGTLAQEAAVVNLVPPDERLLVASNGYFGDRFVAIGRAHGITVDHLTVDWGESVTPEMLDAALAANGTRAVALTHVETSTGIAAPAADLARVAHDRGALVILDAVCSLGGMPVEMDAWGVDVVLSGAQKALGVPPGMVILALSGAAMDRRRSLGRVNAYYADLLNWEPSMRDPTQYFSTHAVNLFYGLDVALGIIRGEGLDARYARHDALARGFRAGMAALGFDSLTQAPYLAPTMSVLAYPEGVDDLAFRRALGAHGVVAAGCLGPWRGRGVRFGHMGNIDEGTIIRALEGVGRALEDLCVDADPALALHTARAAAEGTPAVR
jgi:aspartate aminotransferase-like enzyme